ncbi:MAG: LiaI-LiaF-like domain-containing protein [Bacillota bacterium]
MKDYRRYVGGVVNGLLVVAVGVILLLHNLGYISWDLWTAILKLWPLLLILGGLNIIFFGRSYIGLGVLILVAVVIIVGVNLGFGRDADGHTYFGYGGSLGGPRFTQVIEKSQPLPAGATRGAVRIEMAAGRLEVGGASTALVEARFDQRNWPESLRPEIVGDGGQVTIRQSSLRSFGGIGGLTNQTWTFKLTDQVPLDLTANIGAGDVHLDLSTYKLESLHYNAGAASTTVTLGDRSPRVTVQLRAGAASTTVEVPKDAGVRVTVSTGIGRSNLGTLGYSKQGRTYTSPNYDTSATRIDIDYSGGVGSFDLQPR